MGTRYLGFLRALMILCSLLVALSASAVVITMRKGSKGKQQWPVPSYFSGTNARGYGLAEATYFDTLGLHRVRMLLNGEVVYDQTYDPFDPNDPLSAGVRRIPEVCIFDSTHWSPGSVVEVKIEASEYSLSYGIGPTLTASYSAPIKNAALASEGINPILEPDGAPAAAQAHFQMNYASTLVNDSPYDVAAYDNMTQWKNLIFVNSEGGAVTYDMGDGLTSASPSNASPSDFGWLQHRTFNNGFGLPPFNTWQCPVNFADLEVCHAGDQLAFETILFPYSDAYGHYEENQAVWAYTCFMKGATTESLTEDLYGLFQQNKTVGQVMLDILPLRQGKADASDDGGQTYRDLALPDLGIVGDLHARLKGVYTGSTYLPSAPNSWFMINGVL